MEGGGRVAAEHNHTHLHLKGGRVVAGVRGAGNSERKNEILKCCDEEGKLLMKILY